MTGHRLEMPLEVAGNHARVSKLYSNGGQETSSLLSNHPSGEEALPRPPFGRRASSGVSRAQYGESYFGRERRVVSAEEGAAYASRRVLHDSDRQEKELEKELEKERQDARDSAIHQNYMNHQGETTSVSPHLTAAKPLSAKRSLSSGGREYGARTTSSRRMSGGVFRRRATTKEHNAATRIQAVWKGYIWRERYVEKYIAKIVQFRKVTYDVFDGMFVEVLHRDILPDMLIEILSNPIDDDLERYSEEKSAMIAVVESIVDDTVRGLSKDIVAEVTDDTVVDYFRDQRQKKRSVMERVLDTLIKDFLGVETEKIVDESVVELVNEYLFKRWFNEMFDGLIADSMQEVAYDSVEEWAIHSVLTDIVEEVADESLLELAEVTVVEEEEGAKLRREKEDATAMGHAVTTVIERAILQHLLATISTKGEGVSFSSDVLMPLLSNVLIDNLLNLAVEIGDNTRSFQENSIVRAMVHEAAHAKLLQGFLRQLYAQHEAPSFEQTSQLHDVSSTKDGETQGLSFARMVQERNRLAQEVLDIAQGPVDAPVLYGGGRSDNEIDRADEIVQEAKRKKAEEARRRQEKLQEKIQLLQQRASSRATDQNKLRIQRIVTTAQSRTRTSQEVKEDIVTQSFLDGTKS